VEHALSNHLNHPWRTIAVVAAGIASIELLGLIIVAAALLAKPVAHHVRQAAIKHAQQAASAKPQPKTPAKPLPPRTAVSVTVLNGNGVSGAAASTASRVRARGYKIRFVGNAPRTGYGRSVVIYRGARRPEAYRLSRDLGIRLISPLDGLRARNFSGAQLAVIVGG
jgi:LytR cell envelope-related transcriptional attenuator